MLNAFPLTIMYQSSSTTCYFVGEINKTSLIRWVNYTDIFTPPLRYYKLRCCKALIQASRLETRAIYDTFYLEGSKAQHRLALGGQESLDWSSGRTSRVTWPVCVGVRLEPISLCGVIIMSHIGASEHQVVLFSLCTSRVPVSQTREEPDSHGGIPTCGLSHHGCCLWKWCGLGNWEMSTWSLENCTWNKETEGGNKLGKLIMGKSQPQPDPKR